MTCPGSDFGKRSKAKGSSIFGQTEHCKIKALKLTHSLIAFTTLSCIWGRGGPGPWYALNRVPIHCRVNRHTLHAVSYTTDIFGNGCILYFWPVKGNPPSTERSCKFHAHRPEVGTKPGGARYSATCPGALKAQFILP